MANKRQNATDEIAARLAYKDAARRYGKAIAVYARELEDIHMEFLQWRWPGVLGNSVESLDARMLDAFKAAGLELRDLHPPDAERAAPLPDGQKNGTEG